MAMVLPFLIGAALGAGKTALNPQQRGHWQDYLINAGEGAAMGGLTGGLGGLDAGAGDVGTMAADSSINPSAVPTLMGSIQATGDPMAFPGFPTPDPGSMATGFMMPTLDGAGSNPLGNLLKKTLGKNGNNLSVNANFNKQEPLAPASSVPIGNTTYLPYPGDVTFPGNQNFQFKQPFRQGGY